jgi:hypothetical protein
MTDDLLKLPTDWLRKVEWLERLRHADCKRSPIRLLPCWLPDGWRDSSMTFFDPRHFTIVSRPVFKFGLQYEAQDDDDPVDPNVPFGVFESGLVLLAVWTRNGRPAKAVGDALTTFDFDPVLAVGLDDRLDGELAHFPQMRVWLPEELEGRRFLIQPRQFRAWQKSAGRDRWRLWMNVVTYGAAAMPDAIVELREVPR